jgi:dTDP-4-amino-4,6-dideoxygalactose transaminase
MSDYKYNPWPLGKVPKELQRPELDKLKELGYEFSDPRDVVDMFEKKVAAFAGSKYAVAVDCCTHAMELCLRYLNRIGEINRETVITIPEQTYVSAALLIDHLGMKVNFEKVVWSGIYEMKGTRVWDGATRWTKNMYVGNNALQCISFQIKKRIPIGRGGMILCSNEEEYEWLKLASYDGRDLKTPYTDKYHMKFYGWHYYMTPEDAARGIILMDSVPELNEDTASNTSYPNVKDMLANVWYA